MWLYTDWFVDTHIRKSVYQICQSGDHPMRECFAGLKQAMAMVNDYNVLMKDLPLNELMAATDMDAIRVALINIFTHMKKLRNTKYPIARALRFVEAISKDVYTQMLKVGTYHF